MWPLAGAVILLVILGAFLWYACTVPSSQVFGPALVRGGADHREVALTFDDGPTSRFSEQILDILRDRKVPATFFVCGENVERNPDVARRMMAEGHTLGNHTYSHPFLLFKSAAAMAEEIDRTQEVILNAVGVRPHVFRPPYGIRWFGLVPLLRARGMRLVQWSDSGSDWKFSDSREIAKAVLRKLRSGAVILLHDGNKTLAPEKVDRSNTVNALPEIIEGVRKRGFEFVPLEKFLQPQK